MVSRLGRFEAALPSWRAAAHANYAPRGAEAGDAAALRKERV